MKEFFMIEISFGTEEEQIVLVKEIQKLLNDIDGVELNSYPFIHSYEYEICYPEGLGLEEISKAVYEAVLKTMPECYSEGSIELFNGTVDVVFSFEKIENVLNTQMEFVVMDRVCEECGELLVNGWDYEPMKTYICPNCGREHFLTAKTEDEFYTYEIINGKVIDK